MRASLQIGLTASDKVDDFGVARDDNGLLAILSSLAKLVQQPRVLNGDDGLLSEILHERDLLLGNGTDLLAV
jgi:hypothetical protein